MPARCNLNQNRWEMMDAVGVQFWKPSPTWPRKAQQQNRPVNRSYFKVNAASDLTRGPWWKTQTLRVVLQPLQLSKCFPQGQCCSYQMLTFYGTFSMQQSRWWFYSSSDFLFSLLSHKTSPKHRTWTSTMFYTASGVVHWLFLPFRPPFSCSY